MLDLIESGVLNVYIKLISTWWRLSRIPIGAFGNALHCTYIGCLSSIMQSLTEIYERNFEISWNFFKMGINYAMNLRPDFMRTNLLLSWMFPLRFYCSLFCKWPLYTFYSRINASRLVRFWKTRRHVNKGKTQCWALFVISKATFTKQGLTKILW